MLLPAPFLHASATLTCHCSAPLLCLYASLENACPMYRRRPRPSVTRAVRPSLRPRLSFENQPISIWALSPPALFFPNPCRNSVNRFPPTFVTFLLLLSQLYDRSQQLLIPAQLCFLCPFYCCACTHLSPVRVTPFLPPPPSLLPIISEGRHSDNLHPHRIVCFSFSLLFSLFPPTDYTSNFRVFFPSRPQVAALTY